MKKNSQKISISLSPEWINYAEAYQEKHGLSSRSEVIAKAMQSLREHELAEGYRALAEEYKAKPDSLLDSGINEGLEPSTEDDW